MANGIVETVVREEAEKIAAECLGVVTSAQAITEEVWALGTRVHTVLDRNSHRALRSIATAFVHASYCDESHCTCVRYRWYARRRGRLLVRSSRAMRL